MILRGEKREIGKREKIEVSKKEKEILEKLEKEGTKERIKPLKIKGQFLPQIATLKSGEKVIFKPRQEEFLLRYERASYLTSSFLFRDIFPELPLVPPTVIREIGGQKGIFQLFIPETEALAEINLKKAEKSLKEQLLAFLIFDYIINQKDRRGNLLITKEEPKRIFLIDNEEISPFSPLSKLPPEIFDVEIPLRIKEGLRNFCNSKGKIERTLTDLLKQKEVDFCFKRAERILEVIEKYGRIPKEKEEYLEDIRNKEGRRKQTKLTDFLGD
ncbi:hypothetical protein J7J18_04330 [bacterium]|nr:hypothetical protein [bacterium]